MKKKSIPGLTPPKAAVALLDRYYLEARSHLLETAAILDRIERASGGSQALEDPRIKNLFQAFEIIKQKRGNRAEQFLRILSIS
ncbi:MAG: hypothetical protein RBR67_04355 [Desulfobacterium sp.]|jgi:hypothetical protein|nr:hypothetical protein [Desulfobacterium sp.]